MESNSSASFPFFSAALLDELEPESVAVLLLLGELRSLTKWDERTLVEQLGCGRNSASRSKYSAAELIQHSVAFLEWIVELCNLVDREVDRRDIVHGAYELCASVGGTLADRVATCRAAMDSPSVEQLSGRELVKLGELAQAWRQAALATECGPARERAETLHTLAAPLTEVVSHLHPRRLRALFADTETRMERLGSDVALRMDEHLRDCTKCASVAAELGLHDGPSATRAHAA